MKYIIEDRRKIIIPANMSKGKRRRVIDNKGSYYQYSFFGGAAAGWGPAATAKRFVTTGQAEDFAVNNLGRKSGEFKIQKTFI